MEYNKEKGDGKEKLSQFIAKYGTYLLVVLCVLGIAIASFVIMPAENKSKQNEVKNGATNSSMAEQSTTDDTQTEQVSSSRDEELSDVLNPETGKPYESMNHAPDASRPTATPAPDFTPAPTKESESHSLLPTPVQGEIIWGYAMNELIYSKTLDQWTTHCGVDIACKQGEKVRSVAAGTVETVYTDAAFGITVVIKHQNGHTSIYSNLADSDELAKEGAKVKANEVIGAIGNTAAFESEDKSHLHFEYHVKGKAVDPTDYVFFENAQA